MPPVLQNSSCIMYRLTVRWNTSYRLSFQNRRIATLIFHNPSNLDKSPRDVTVDVPCQHDEINWFEATQYTIDTAYSRGHWKFRSFGVLVKYRVSSNGEITVGTGFLHNGAGSRSFQSLHSWPEQWTKWPHNRHYDKHGSDGPGLVAGIPHCLKYQSLSQNLQIHKTDKSVPARLIADKTEDLSALCAERKDNTRKEQTESLSNGSVDTRVLVYGLR